jgi:hypothetical protein
MTSIRPGLEELLHKTPQVQLDQIIMCCREFPTHQAAGKNATPLEKVKKLLDWAESPHGKGLEYVARVVYNYFKKPEPEPVQAKAKGGTKPEYPGRTQTKANPGSMLDRLELLNSLNDMNEQSFKRIVLVSGVQASLMPSEMASRGDRVFALLCWAESHTGCGLQRLVELLGIK